MYNLEISHAHRDICIILRYPVHTGIYNLEIPMNTGIYNLEIPLARRDIYNLDKNFSVSFCYKSGKV